MRDAQPVSENSQTESGHTVKLAAAGRTDVGRRRPHNEDSIEVSEELALFAIADGMGGHAAGEVASRMAVETLREFVVHAARDRDFTWPFGIDENRTHAENVLITAFHLANRKVCQLAGENIDYMGMGTTLAVVYMPDGQAHIAHVGDSRVYRMRKDQLELLTMDHSWVNEQLQRNIITEDEARTHRWRNVITRALGNRTDLEVDLKTVDTQAGDLFMICSDGLTGMLENTQIAEILANDPSDLGLICDNLVEAANAAGGLDNISVILIRIIP
jgi:protein phosphatase